MNSSKIREGKNFFFNGGFYLPKKKQTPSLDVDQKNLLDDKVAAFRKNNFEDNHIRIVTPNGAQGQKKKTIHLLFETLTIWSI